MLLGCVVQQGLFTRLWAKLWPFFSDLKRFFECKSRCDAQSHGRKKDLGIQQLTRLVYMGKIGVLSCKLDLGRSSVNYLQLLIGSGERVPDTTYQASVCW